jgi:phage baseplate assembly protein gpV
MNQAVLENLVRIGVVSAVDKGKRKARVMFDDIGITSGWLFVIQHHEADIHVEPDNSHTHIISDTYTGSGSASTIPDHDHPGTYRTYWMPKVGETVLVLYLPVRDGDGFILGGI